MYGESIIIETDLQLRPPNLKEAPAFVEWFQDPDVTRYLASDFQGLGVKEQEDFFRQREQEKNRYFWVIAELGSDKVIGSVELKLSKPENETARLGIVIADKSKWGKGYGRKIILTLINFAFYKLGMNRLELSCVSVNARALKCYAHCGFVEEGRKRQAFFIKGCVREGVTFNDGFYDEIIMAIISGDLID